MRRLRSVDNEQVQLEVIECDCGYHMGIDSTYIEHVDDFQTICPSCGNIIDTAVVCPENGDEGECNEMCAQHHPNCDGFCDHLDGHTNACWAGNFSNNGLTPA